MLFAVRFYDRADRADIRNIYMDAHLQWLESVRSGVLIAGSLREHATAHPDDALWIVEAASKETVETLLKQDPFWQEGLRQNVNIRLWSKAFDSPVTL
ncbi:YciI family protein [Pantoea stewartii]|uniref:YciI family protein n=1 Tax=Pantoea stewartii TaxID=66269 RepID=UPI002DBC3ED8|nr:YciI family protein [Pantoea stewartii]MEB6536146.1 YciI family protein [Pantoea stewartii]